MNDQISRDAATPLTRISLKCQVCQKPATFMCSACGDSIMYCSRNCQEGHWPTHKTNCLASKKVASRNGNNNPSVTNTSGSSSSGAATGSGGQIGVGQTDRQSRSIRLNEMRSPPRGKQNSQENILPFLNSFLVNPVSGDQPENDPDPLRTEEEQIEDVKFYSKQIHYIIQPVILCIIFSILWVKLTTQTTDFYDVM